MTSHFMKSINPANGQQFAETVAWNEAQALAALDKAQHTQAHWAKRAIVERAELLAALAKQLRAEKAALSRLISDEMGKLLAEAEAEVEKCAVTCDYYSESAEDLLADEMIASDASDSFLVLQPLGTVLAVMPWNFPLWQVMRCAIPALLAGNSVLLKHSSNVQLVAQAAQQLFLAAGFPEGLFLNLPIAAPVVAALLADPRVHAVSVTGSEQAGRAVAAIAGANLKKCVLELGGSDAFVVLPDADLQKTVKVALQSRFMNCGQSCIAAKRFILTPSIADEFIEAFAAEIAKLKCGNPLSADTSLAPMARDDLRQELKQQVQQSVARGAKLLIGGDLLQGEGFYYQPGLLDHVAPGMPAYEEELFGPVASIIRVSDEAEALSVANSSRFGLGGSVWGEDLERAEAFARDMQSGAVFVNGLVKSDARLPFGGIKASGYGRELSLLGLKEFCNIKTMWVA